MKNTILLLLIGSFFALEVTAQKINYTYVSDKKVRGSGELYGYQLVPNEWEGASGQHDRLKPGEVTFNLFRGYLVIEGGQSAGTYNISRSDANGRVIQFYLLDAKDPSKQGSLKVIRDDNNFVDAYIFRKSRNDDEVIYYQAGLSAEQKRKNKDFFTDKNEIIFETDEQIWGKKIRPFFVINPSKSNRVYPQDSVQIRFHEEIIIKEKPVKEPIVAKPKKKKKEEDTDDEFEEDSDADVFFDDDDLEDLDDLEDEETPADAMIPTTNSQANSAEAEAAKWPKIKKEHSIFYTHKATDGSVVTEEIAVKKMKRKASEIGVKGAKTLIEFYTNEGLIQMYLNGKNSVSMIEINGKRYLMRGY